MPIKLYEYMAMGKSVITTRLPGILKEFGDDNGVIYVDTPGEVLKEAIVLSRTESANEEGRKARRFGVLQMSLRVFGSVKALHERKRMRILYIAISAIPN